ncbi:unnamed protein product [Darwinula stevensoni]|uniref:VWFC domain-containing protein n=1 Tax=Darwinula stevensoni TaxID=69355 RepID=A0A7R8X8K0_9CRUS|nr:unnamed protein product [Darwinula stevensoni]CAG0884550.1 unnamed protein product [Darwinula stevensoni]
MNYDMDLDVNRASRGNSCHAVSFIWKCVLAEVTPDLSLPIPIDCEVNGRVYGNGAKIENPDKPCEVCSCQGGDVKCNLIECFWRNDCTPKYQSGRCCPTYTHCPPLNSQTMATFAPGKSSPLPRPPLIGANQGPIGISTMETNQKEDKTTISPETTTEVKSTAVKREQSTTTEAYTEVTSIKSKDGITSVVMKYPTVTKVEQDGNDTIIEQIDQMVTVEVMPNKTDDIVAPELELVAVGTVEDVNEDDDEKDKNISTEKTKSSSSPSLTPALTHPEDNAPAQPHMVEQSDDDESGERVVTRWEIVTEIIDTRHESIVNFFNNLFAGDDPFPDLPYTDKQSDSEVEEATSLPDSPDSLTIIVEETSGEGRSEPETNHKGPGMILEEYQPPVTIIHQENGLGPRTNSTTTEVPSNMKTVSGVDDNLTKVEMKGQTLAGPTKMSAIHRNISKNKINVNQQREEMKKYKYTQEIRPNMKMKGNNPSDDAHLTAPGEPDDPAGDIGLPSFGSSAGVLSTIPDSGVASEIAYFTPDNPPFDASGILPLQPELLPSPPAGIPLRGPNPDLFQHALETKTITTSMGDSSNAKDLSEISTEPPSTTPGSRNNFASHGAVDPRLQPQVMLYPVSHMEDLVVMNGENTTTATDLKSGNIHGVSFGHEPESPRPSPPVRQPFLGFIPSVANPIASQNLNNPPGPQAFVPLNQPNLHAGEPGVRFHPAASPSDLSSGYYPLQNSRPTTQFQSSPQSNPGIPLETTTATTTRQIVDEPSNQKEHGPQSGNQWLPFLLVPSVRETTTAKVHHENETATLPAHNVKDELTVGTILNVTQDGFNRVMYRNEMENQTKTHEDPDTVFGHVVSLVRHILQ